MAFKTVNVPGYGPVNFPDSMSDDDINAASKSLYDQSQSSAGPNGPTDFGQKVIDNANKPPQADPREELARQIGMPNPQPARDARAEQLRRAALGDPQTPGYSPEQTPVPQLPGEPGAPTNTPVKPTDSRINIFNPETRKAFYDTVGAPFSQGVNGLVAGADLGVTMGLNGIGSAFAGGAGVAQGFGTGSNDAATQTVEKWSPHIQPFTPQGKAVAQGVAQTVGKVDDTVKEAAWRVSGGNPALATIAYTALNALPSEEGFVSAGSVRNSAMNLFDKTKSFYENRGITLGSKKMEEQMSDYAQTRNQDVPRPRGQALVPVIADVRSRYNKGQADIVAAQDEIAASKGKVSVNGVSDAMDTVDARVQQDYAPYMWEQKPGKINPETGEVIPPKLTGYQWARNEVQKLIDRENAQKNSKAPGNYVPLQELDALRTKIKNLPGADSGPIAVLHDGMDNFINNQIASGFIRGDKNLQANSAYLKGLRDKYARQFSPGTEVYRMATDLHASPEDFSKYIFNMSDSGFKTEAAQTVKQLADIFGNNSPQLDAVRMEFLGKVLEPLRGPEPDWAGFRAIYDKSLRNNSTLVGALSPYMERDLEQLYRLSSASAKVGPQRGIIWSNVRRNLIREAAGNSLARNNTKLNVYNTALNFVLAKSSADVKSGLLKELTGVDRAIPLFRPGSPELQTLWAGALNQEARD